MTLDDATRAAGLRGFVAAAGPILDLLATAGEAATTGRPVATGIAGRARRALTPTHVPGSATWPTLPAQIRSDWWSSRIWMVLGAGAAAPELAGSVSDRFPVGAAVEAAARGPAVCATAREHGVTAVPAQVRLLSHVFLGRDDPVGDSVPDELMPDDSAVDDGAWPRRPRSITEAAVEAVRIGRGLAGVIDGVAVELDRLTPAKRRTGWGRLPAIAAVRTVTDLRSTLRADVRATVGLLDRSSSGGDS